MSLWRALRTSVAWLLRWTTWLLWTLCVQVSVVLMLALLWLCFSDEAPAWLWQQLSPQWPALQVEGLRGRLVTGLDVDRLHWADADYDVTLKHLHLRWQVTDLPLARLSLGELHAGDLRVRQLRDKPPEPLSLPALSLPVVWRAPDLHVDHLAWQPFTGEQVTLDDLSAAGEGGGSRVTLQRLHLRHALGVLEASGHVELRDNWPLALTLRVTPADTAWPAQRADLSGDLAALRVQAHGPTRLPLRLDVTADVRPVQPLFRGRLSWPRWTPPGQKDWLLAAGGLDFQGTAARGSANLTLEAEPLRASSLPWPAGWPRRASLAGPLSWQTDSSRAQLAVNWQGRFGAMPWQVKGGFDSAHRAATRLDMLLADARLALAGWPEEGIQAELSVPRLTRFQSAVSGGLSLTAHWRGTPPAGQGRISLRATALRQGGKALADAVQVVVDGGLASQTWQIEGHRDGLSARLALNGSLDLAQRIWQGRLLSGDVGTPSGAWQLRAPAGLRLAPDGSRLDEQCWQQAPWQVCGEADLHPAQWTARLHAEAPGWGRLQASMRRDPRRTDPPLDADLVLDQVDLAHLPVSLPPGLTLAGQASARARLTGTLATPVLTGDFGIEAGALRLPAYGLDWRPLRLQGHLLGDHLDWQGQISDASGGTATLTGEARLRPSLTVQARFDGKSLRVIYAPWVTARVDPAIEFGLRQGQLALSGQVLVPEATIRLRQPESGAPRPSDDVRLVGAAAPAASSPGDGLPLDLSLDVRLGDKVALSGMGLTSRLLGHVLLVQRPGQALGAHGELRLSDDAVFEAYGQRLQIRSGRFLFAGAPTRPDIEVEAVRQVDTVTVGVRLSGRAPSPQATLFSSDSTLAQEGILSLLVLGRPLDSSRAPTAAERQALALGAALKLGGGTGAIDRLGQRLGIRDLTLGTQGESDQTLVAVSGNLRPDLFVSVGMGVFSPTQLFKVRYQISKRLSLEAVTSLESAITLFYSWRF